MLPLRLYCKQSHPIRNVHPAARSINSDWFVNRFIVVFYVNFCSVQLEFCVEKMTKNFS